MQFQAHLLFYFAGFEGYLTHLLYTCFEEINQKQVTNIDEAKKECNGDANCTFISSDNIRCDGNFKFCKGTKLEYKKDRCVLQKGNTIQYQELSCVN